MSETTSREFYYDLFDEFWKTGRYQQAIETYEFLGRPFFLAEGIGKYYEYEGLLDRAMHEYEHLIESYQKIRSDFLPLPGGPVELYKLGSWFQETQPEKAERYLKLYLEAEYNDCGTGAFLKYKYRAEKILKRITHGKWKQRIL